MREFSSKQLPKKSFAGLPPGGRRRRRRGLYLEARSKKKSGPPLTADFFDRAEQYAGGADLATSARPPVTGEDG